MKITLFYTLIILGVISIGTAYAEGSLISVQTDNNNYSEKDTIIISGEIATIIGDTQVTMQLFQGANLIEIALIFRSGKVFLIRPKTSVESIPPLREIVTLLADSRLV